MHRAARPWLVVVTLLSPASVHGDEAPPAYTLAGVGRVEPLGPLDTGRDFLEGPALGPDGLLYFTDIPRQQILTLDAEGRVAVFTDRSRHANGLMFNGAGELVACEMDGQVVAWDTKTNARRVIASEYNGVRFNAPNDLVIDRLGGIYFTDPRFRAPEPLPQGRQSVYYIAADGAVARVVDDLPAPNGILLSRDEKTLYVLPTDSASMRAYEVVGPGRLRAGREFCRLDGPTPSGMRGADGATLDTGGNLYVTCGLGVQVVSPRGELLGLIKLPEKPANATLAGNRLYVTAQSSLYAFDLEAVGHRYPGGAGRPAER